MTPPALITNNIVLMECNPEDAPPPSSADDIAVVQCDVPGAMDAVGSTADKKVVSRKWRKVGCEEVEDAGRYWENTGAGDRDVEEEVLQDDNQEEQEVSEHRTQVGGTPDNSIVQRNWTTVECKQVEDEDAAHYREHRGEDDQEVVEEDDEGE